MDLKSLGSGTWRGFSDKELHQVKGKPVSKDQHVLPLSEQLLSLPVMTELIDFADEKEARPSTDDLKETDETLQTPSSESVSRSKLSSEALTGADT